MADLNKVNRLLVIKRHEHSKLIAQANILAREIRISELQDEIGRCEADANAQRKIITESDFNIKQQQEELAKENK